MATPNYEQIQSFGHVTAQLHEAAVDEFTSELYDGMSTDEVLEQAVRIAEKYSMLGAELGAQWYDLCTELAGIEAEPALVSEPDVDRITARANNTLNTATGTLSDAFNYYLQNVINESIRTTGTANLWRDYERGLTGGRWARVPVGDTCAWCLMLASQGAWYLTEESALSKHGAKFHDGCNCIAVYHATPESIRGYDKLPRYKEMYYEADNMRRANANGKEPYSEELEERIANAKSRHEQLEEKKALEAEALGQKYTKNPWTKYNEDMILMRYKFGLK